MKISAKCDYACRVLLELSQRWPQEIPVHIKEISEKQDIPKRYLVQILIQLKQNGWVESIRGKQGGYVLVVSPGQLRLGDVIRRMNGPFVSSPKNGLKGGKVFARIWDELEEAMSAILDKVKFSDICRNIESDEKTLMYQI